MCSGNASNSWPGTREIGIRVALGASRGVILRLMIGQALAWSATGIAAGLAGAFFLLVCRERRLRLPWSLVSLMMAGVVWGARWLSSASYGG